jgi:subtilisin family serine protease
VTIYTLDSGIVLSHQEFQDWAGNSRVSYGIDLVDDDGLAAADCDGHGSHVASSAMGRSVGVAKEARLVAVRVLDCDGEGKISDVIAGEGGHRVTHGTCGWCIECVIARVSAGSAGRMSADCCCMGGGDWGSPRGWQNVHTLEALRCLTAGNHGCFGKTLICPLCKQVHS